MDLQTLYRTLQLRKRPEDVAEMIESLMGSSLTKRELALLKKASRNSLKRSVWQYTSMLQEFALPVGAMKQINKTLTLFRLDKENFSVDYDDPAQIRDFLATVSPLIGKEVGENSFQNDRLNGAGRAAAGLDWSKRQYNKRFRLLVRLEKKRLQIIRMQTKSEHQQMAKNSLARRITWEEFSKDIATACFIAYYTAKCNQRSEFTISGQARAFDEIANMLFKVATGSQKGLRSFEKRVNTANYWAMAFVFPDPRVLKKLTEHQKGMLLGIWTTELGKVAEFLEDLWNQNNINRKTMIVRKGNDSSTWNHAAGAWNKARTAWLNLIYAMNMEFVLDEMCVGKCMRLIAGDLAFWHQAVGNAPEPNTLVWNKLPLPWKVLQGKATCTRNDIIRACRRAGANASLSGWISPQLHDVSRYRPTPELVHGVQVENPYLAEVLKKHRVFSGKPVKSVLWEWLN